MYSYFINCAWSDMDQQNALCQNQFCKVQAKWRVHVGSVKNDMEGNRTSIMKERQDLMAI